MSDVPDEIRALRARLAELEAMADKHSRSDFNTAVRKYSRSGQLDLTPTPAPLEPQPPGTVTRGVQGGPTKPETFNQALRRLRGITTE